MSRITGYSLTMPFAPRMSRAFRQEDLLGPHRARVLPLPEAPGEERHLSLDEASHARPRHALLLAEELVQPVVVDLATLIGTPSPPVLLQARRRADLRSH